MGPKSRDRYSIPTFGVCCFLIVSPYFVFDVFVEEMKYKDNNKRIKKYVEALFNNENLRSLCSWADFVCEVINQMSFDGMWYSDISHKAIRCLLAPFEDTTISHSEYSKVQKVLDKLSYTDIWWGRVTSD